MVEPKRHIACRVDANHEIGFGHFMRSFAFAELCLQRSIDITFIGSLPDFARDKIVKSGMRYQWAQELEQTEAVISYLEEHLIDGVVFDGYHFPQNDFERYQNRSFFTGMIDDFGEIPACFDLIINQNPWASTISYHSQGKQLKGLSYALLRKEFWPYTGKQAPKLRNAIKNVLLNFGGTDPRLQTARIFTILNKSNLAPLHITIVCNDPQTKELILSQDSMHDVTWHDAVNEFTPIMKKCDFAITAAGSTCWELALMNLPMIAIVQAKNQERVAQHIEKLGIGYDMGWFNQFDENLLIEYVKRLCMDDDCVEQMQHNMGNLQIATKRADILHAIPWRNI